MKICYLVHNLGPNNGYGRIASDILLGIQKKGYETLILKEQQDPFEGITILKRGNAYSIGLSALKTFKYIRNCDIIHALDGYPFGIIGYLANIFQNKKFFVTGLGTYAVSPLYPPKTGFLMRKMYNRADVITAMSNYTKNEILKKIPNRKIHVIHPGIDLKKYHHEHSKSEEQFLLSVGALKKRKGYHISIPAFAMAKKEFPNLKYKIVGDQADINYYASLKKLVKQNKIEDAVEFLEGLTFDQLINLYRSAQIFVLVSVNHQHNFEGFGLVFLEAAACGTPSIGTLGNGIEDAIENEKNGLLVPQNDVQKTYKAIIDILSNQNKWNEMSKQSYSWANAHDLSKTISQYVNIYENLIQQDV